jgi:hypothetical protein
MNNIDIEYGMYASKWGLSDFYEESKAKLVDALNSGEDFDTGWWGCKKEIRYARIVREDGKITVEVSAHMDDLWEQTDLIYDALWEERHTEEELPDEIIDSIRDEAMELRIDDSSSAKGTIPADALLCNVVSLINKLEVEAESKNTDMYTRLRGIVAEHYDYWKGEQNNGKDD